MSEVAQKEKTYQDEIEQLKKENALLREQQEVHKMPNESLQSELDKIRQQGVVNTLAIPVKAIDDHKNIVLYTPLNKRIGPLHPRNAEKTMIKFYQAGIQLYTKQRTPEQVEAYKNSDTYKALHQQHLQERHKRHQQRNENAVDFITKKIAKQLGVREDSLTDMPTNPADVDRIKSKHNK